MQYRMRPNGPAIGAWPPYQGVRCRRVTKGTPWLGCGTTRGKGAEGADPLGMRGGRSVRRRVEPGRSGTGAIRPKKQPQTPGHTCWFCPVVVACCTREQVEGAAVCVGSAPGALPRDNSHSASREISREGDGVGTTSSDPPIARRLRDPRNVIMQPKDSRKTWMR